MIEPNAASNAAANAASSITTPIANAASSITNVASDALNKIKTADTSIVKDGLESLTNAYAEQKQNITDSLSSFSSPTEVNASSSFLDTNSLIAKVAFVLLVVVMFVVILNVALSMLFYFMAPSKSPYVIKGLLPSLSSKQQISVNPQNSGSVQIFRSNNQDKGIEFTWSVWLQINSLTAPSDTSSNKFHHIFNKGNNTYDPTTGVATVNNAPGVYLNHATNTIRVYMDSVTSNAQYLDISGVPLKKWFHMAIRLQNNVMDIYINGNITGRHQFTEVPKQNYNDIFIGQDNVDGMLSNLVYYDHALSVFELNNIVLRGPNLVTSSSATSKTSVFDYLSSSWYMSKL